MNSEDYTWGVVGWYRFKGQGGNGNKFAQKNYLWIIRKMSMTPKEKQELVDSYERWYHDFDFGDGVRCTPYTSHPDIWNQIDQLMAEIDFKNKSK